MLAARNNREDGMATKAEANQAARAQLDVDEGAVAEPEATIVAA